MKKRTILITSIFIALMLLHPPSTTAQSILDRTLTLNSRGEKLEKVFASIEKQTGLSFSYRSDIMPLDSLVTIHKEITTVAEALDTLLGAHFEYCQSKNFVIIRHAPLELNVVVTESYGNSENYFIKGKIIDKQTQKPVSQASIYEPRLLASQVSGDDGHFTIKLRKLNQPVSLTVRKEGYKLFTLNFLEDVNITDRYNLAEENYYAGNLNSIEDMWLANALITTRQKIQSLNIGGFLSSAPYQLSLLPGVNTHGSMSGQVINKFSFNAIGAYSAGVDGAEIGLGFNINKNDVQHFQLGGIFNMNGGEVNGVQIAGLFNFDFASLKGTQLSLLYNRVGSTLNGVQLAGLYNRVNRDVRGVQLSIGLNTVEGNVQGVQVGSINLVAQGTKGIQAALLGNAVNARATGFQAAGMLNFNKESYAVNASLIANITAETSNGIQSGLFNYAGTLKGVQVGLINIANRNDGYSVGLVNVAFKGYHKIYLGTDETSVLNMSYKGGSRRLYNSLIFGTNIGNLKRLYAVGLGFGKEVNLSPIIYFNPELSLQYIYQGSWRNLNLLNKYNFPITLKLNKWIGIQAGPSLNFYYTDQMQHLENYELLQFKHKDFSFRNLRYTGWIGWHTGVILF